MIFKYLSGSELAQKVCWKHKYLQIFGYNGINMYDILACIIYMYICSGVMRICLLENSILRNILLYSREVETQKVRINRNINLCVYVNLYINVWVSSKHAWAHIIYLHAKLCSYVYLTEQTDTNARFVVQIHIHTHIYLYVYV